MIQFAEVPVGNCAWEVGKVVSHDEENGTITIETDDGHFYRGCESLARFFTEKLSEEL